MHEAGSVGTASDGNASRRRAWRRVLLGALLLSVAPAFSALVLQSLARAAGCVPARTGACLLAGFDLGAAMRSVLNLAWGFVSAALLVAFIVAVCLVAAHRAWRTTRPRMAFGFAIPLLLPAAMILLPELAVLAGSHEDCVINERGEGACVAYGTEMGYAYHAAAIAPWLLLVYVPLGALASLAYAGFLAVLAFRRRRAEPARAEDGLAAPRA